MPSRKTIAEFWSLVEVRGPNDCWYIRLHRQKNGYPSFGRHTAHAWIYEQLHGIPRGPSGRRLDIDHLCHVAGECTLPKMDCPHRLCVNPAHLEAKTAAANVMRGNSPVAANASKTSCPTCGSEYRTMKNGTAIPFGRRCPVCMKARDSKRLNGWARARLAAQRARQAADVPPDGSTAQ